MRGGLLNAVFRGNIGVIRFVTYEAGGMSVRAVVMADAASATTLHTSELDVRITRSSNGSLGAV